MKVYISGWFEEKGQEVESLSRAIRAANMKEFYLERDNQSDGISLNNQKLRWEKAYDELGACDALLAVVEGVPSGKTVLECGMAYALRKPIVVAVKSGSGYKGQLEGVASTVIEYIQYKDLTKPLKKYEHDRTFTITDNAMLFAVLLAVGAALSWLLGLLFLPLAPIGAIGYWLVVRWLFVSMRDFDRIVIYIPLAALWAGGIFLFKSVSSELMWGWALGFWLLALAVIQRSKLSL